MKKFRRISTLALVIVLVCLFSASAFASSAFNQYQDYEGDGTVYAYAEIEEKETWANLEVSVMDMVDDTFYIDLECSFVNSYNKMEYDDDHADFSSESYGTLRYYYSKVKKMETADYTFYAEFNSSVSFGERMSFGPVYANLTYTG